MWNWSQIVLEYYLLSLIVDLYIHHRYTREIPEPAPFLSWHGAQIGVFGFFRNQNNLGSSGAYVTCIYWGLSMKINVCKTLHGTRRLWTHLFCVCFLCVWSARNKDSQFEPNGWRCQYMSSGFCMSAIFSRWVHPTIVGYEKENAAYVNTL